MLQDENINTTSILDLHTMVECCSNNASLEINPTLVQHVFLYLLTLIAVSVRIVYDIHMIPSSCIITFLSHQQKTRRPEDKRRGHYNKVK